MARKRSKIKTVFVLCVLGLAAFGAYVLWERWSGNFKHRADTISERAHKVKKALTE